MFVALEFFGVSFNGGPSHRPFWVTRDKQQVICMGLIIDFVSLLFSRVEAMLGFLLFLGIVPYTPVRSFCFFWLF
jgi:hypothetical protein